MNFPLLTLPQGTRMFPVVAVGGIIGGHEVPALDGSGWSNVKRGPMSAPVTTDVSGSLWISTGGPPGTLDTYYIRPLAITKIKN